MLFITVVLAIYNRPDPRAAQVILAPETLAAAEARGVTPDELLAEFLQQGGTHQQP